MKKLLVLVLAIAMAIGVMGGAIGAFAEEGAMTPADFASAENLFVDTIGLHDTYEFDGTRKENRPYPSDWGVKFAKTSDGFYTRVNNNMQENVTSGSHTATYLATSKDVSGVKTYYVSAKIKVGERRDWGGLGIVLGKGTDADQSPFGIWYGFDSKTLYLAAAGNEFLNVFGAEEDVTIAVGDTMKIAAVVDNGNVTAYINDQQIGTTYTLPDTVTFEPAVGAEVKQYVCEYTDFEFKTLETDLAPAQYTITCISGAVEIGTIDYTYGDGAALTPIERAGYTFMGWHYLPDLSDAVVTEVDAAIGGDITVYCEYQVATYTITYYDGDTVIENEDWVSTFNFKEYISLPVAEKDGYTFDGWYTNPEFTDEAVEAIEMNTTGNQTFYAKFTAEGGNDQNDQDDNQDDNKDDETVDEAGGCGSSIAAASGLLAAAMVGGAAVLFRKRK